MGQPRKPALDSGRKHDIFERKHDIFEHAHAPFAGAERLVLGVSVEFLLPADGRCLRVALTDLVPVSWSWDEPDAHGCFNGQAQAYVPAGREREAEQALQAALQAFKPGYGLAWTHPVPREP